MLHNFYLFKNIYLLISSYLRAADGDTLKKYETRLFSLLSEIHKGAVLLTDAFDWVDSNLCKFQ